MGYCNAFRICGILCIFNFIIVTYNMTIIDASVFMTGAFFNLFLKNLFAVSKESS